MRPLLLSLHSLLVEQKGVLEVLLELSQQERRVIISGQAEHLEDVIRKELKELSKLNAIEKKRVAMHADFAAEFSIPAGEITISAIVGRADPEEREALKQLQTQLNSLLKQHQELNNENRELIKAHIEYTSAMMELMVDSEDPLNNFYGGDGKAVSDRRKSTGFIDGKA